MGDLPDFQLEVVSATVEATSFRSGIDADKPASPAAGDIWLARDTSILYVCAVAGAWTGFDASQLVQGTLTLFANMVGGGYKLTGIGAPAAATDGARKSEVDAVDAKLDDVAKNDVTGSRSLGGTVYQNTSGKIRIVTISLHCLVGDYERIDVRCDSGSTPSDVVAQTGFNDYSTDDGIEAEFSVTFVVPPSHYYSIAKTGTPDLLNWLEWDLL